MKKWHSWHTTWYSRRSCHVVQLDWWKDAICRANVDLICLKYLFKIAIFSRFCFLLRRPWNFPWSVEPPHFYHDFVVIISILRHPFHDIIILTNFDAWLFCLVSSVNGYNFRRSPRDNKWKMSNRFQFTAVPSYRYFLSQVYYVDDKTKASMSFAIRIGLRDKF